MTRFEAPLTGGDHHLIIIDRWRTTRAGREIPDHADIGYGCPDTLDADGWPTQYVRLVGKRIRRPVHIAGLDSHILLPMNRVPPDRADYVLGAYVRLAMDHRERADAAKAAYDRAPSDWERAKLRREWRQIERKPHGIADLLYIARAARRVAP